MWAIGLLSFFAFGIFLIIGIVSAIRKKGKFKKNLLYAGISFIIFIIAASATDSDNKVETAGNMQANTVEVQTADAKVKDESNAEDKVKAEEKAKEEAEAKVAAEELAKKEAETKEKSVPREHKSALKKAEMYAETMDMSKAGIYDQLTSEYGENFPPEAAQYAIDNLVFDWKENALKKAKMYAETMEMSDSAIYDQLTSEYGEKFTAEEAKYAIDNLE